MYIEPHNGFEPRLDPIAMITKNRELADDNMFIQVERRQAEKQVHGTIDVGKKSASRETLIDDVMPVHSTSLEPFDMEAAELKPCLLRASLHSQRGRTFYMSSKGYRVRATITGRN